MINILKRKHKCNFETIHTIKNEKGEKWTEKCECGKERIVLFNAEGDCVYIGKEMIC